MLRLETYLQLAQPKDRRVFERTDVLNHHKATAGDRWGIFCGQQHQIWGFKELILCTSFRPKIYFYTINLDITYLFYSDISPWRHQYLEWKKAERLIRWARREYKQKVQGQDNTHTHNNFIKSLFPAPLGDLYVECSQTLRTSQITTKTQFASFTQQFLWTGDPPPTPFFHLMTH